MRLQRARTWILSLALIPCLFAFQNFMQEWEIYVPKGFPALPQPPDNIANQARAELGKKLFFDPVLSRDSTISCGSCHRPQFAFGDNRAISPGVQGRLDNRNAPSIANVAYAPMLLFDRSVPTLEMQVLVPVQEHAEMDFSLPEAATRLLRDSSYVRMSQAAYQRPPDAYVITRALGAYERTLLSGDAPWDQYRTGSNPKALSPAARQGLALFQSSRTGCSNCHSGVLLTDYSLRNNGLPTSPTDSGRAEITHLPEDRGLFRVPSLRNVALTAPYMHDGSIPSLSQVIEHYNSGGHNTPGQDTLIHPLKLNHTEKKALIAFLSEGLTDQAFLRRHLAP